MPIAGDGGAYNWPSADGRSHGEPPRLPNCRRSPPEARSPQRTGASQGNGLQSLQSRIIPQIKQRCISKSAVRPELWTKRLRYDDYSADAISRNLSAVQTARLANETGSGSGWRRPNRTGSPNLGGALPTVSNRVGKTTKGCSTTELRRQTSRSPHSFTPTAFLTKGVLHWSDVFPSSSPVVLRVLGRLPLMDRAARTGGRRPRSLREGNRAPERARRCRWRYGDLNAAGAALK